MKAESIAHAVSYAEFACQQLTMKHAKQYLRECGVDLLPFEKALKASKKSDFLDALWTIQANERWNNK